VAEVQAVEGHTAPRLCAPDEALREEMIDVYGGECVTCGETMREALTLAYMPDARSEERRLLLMDWRRAYRELQARGWPQDDYQLLCANCQRRLLCAHYQRR